MPSPWHLAIYWLLAVSAQFVGVALLAWVVYTFDHQAQIREWRDGQ